MKGKRKLPAPMLVRRGGVTDLHRAHAIDLTVGEYAKWIAAVIEHAAPMWADHSLADMPGKMLAAIQSGDLLAKATIMPLMAPLHHDMNAIATGPVATEAGSQTALRAALAYNLIGALAHLAAASVEYPYNERVDYLTRVVLWANCANEYLIAFGVQAPPLPISAELAKNAENGSKMGPLRA